MTLPRGTDRLESDRLVLRRIAPDDLPFFTRIHALAAGEPVRLIGHRCQNPCDGMRNARLNRADAFSHAMIIVSSAMVSSS